MHYSDIADGTVLQSSNVIADYFGTHYLIGRAIVLACREAYALGTQGKPCPVPLASRDACELVHDAWHDGIVGRKLTVIVESGEAHCSECGDCLDDDEACESCPDAPIDRCVTLSVSAPFADVWADWDQSIEGSNWETPSDMPHYAYTCTCDYPGLVASLRADGYTLDLSNYTGDES